MTSVVATPEAFGVMASMERPGCWGLREVMSAGRGEIVDEMIQGDLVESAQSVTATTGSEMLWPVVQVWPGRRVESGR
jgi:hypothetical protein